MKWNAIISGDMTLSIVDEENFQILKIDMLKARTMEHDTNGDRIVRSMNDLYVISQFPDEIYDIDLCHPIYDEDGHSPLPWSIDYNMEKRRIQIKDGKRKKICERDYPKTVPMEKINEIYEILDSGITELNDAQDFDIDRNICEGLEQGFYQ